MEDTITQAIRALVREELAAAPKVQRAAARTPPPRIELPLRPGEVERHYPAAEVARLLGMSKSWVYERINDGTFAVANFGAAKSKRRIPASSINAFISTHTFSK